MKPRRQGLIKEYQNGHYFMYVTEWEEQQRLDGGKARPHREVEIYYVPITRIVSTNDPVWSSTDPKQFHEAIELFMADPELFAHTTKVGELPVKETNNA
jgi:hypothetical protein